MLNIPTWLIIDIRRKLETVGLDPYSIREYFRENPTKCIKVTMLLCALPLLFAIMLSLRPTKDHSKTVPLGKEWFYDLNTGKLFLVKAGVQPPVESPSGLLPNGDKAGVRAYVFKYEDAAEKFVGFLETTINKKSWWSFGAQSESWEKTRLIKRVEDDQWYPADSNDGRAIREQLAKPNQNGKMAKYCRPVNE